MMYSITSAQNFKITQNRIIPEGIFDRNRPEKPGIRAYSKIIGKILLLFKFAVRLEAFEWQDGRKIPQVWYVNIKSLNQWKQRQADAYAIHEDFDFRQTNNLDLFIKAARASRQKDSKKLLPKTKKHKPLKLKKTFPPTKTSPEKVPNKSKKHPTAHTRKITPAQVEAPVENSVNTEKQQAEKFLKDLWKVYNEAHTAAPALLNYYTFVLLRSESSPGSTASVPPDCGLSNLAKEFEKDPEVYYVPDPYYKNPSFGDSKNRLDQKIGINHLVKVAKAAFLMGKKLVVGRFASHRHCVTLGMTNTGRVLLIDSMFDHEIKLPPVVKALNRAKMCDALGRTIHFQGEAINTHLQPGGHDCTRLASLYAYHIAKERDLDAYQEVNGAFNEGKLQTFEDHKKISGSQKLKDASQIPSEKIQPFCNSWVSRALNIEVDDWRNLPLKRFLESNGCIIFKAEVESPRAFPVPYEFFPNTRVLIQTASGGLKDYMTQCQNEDFLTKTCGDLVKDPQKKWVILSFENQETPRCLLYLNPNEELILADPTTGKKAYVITS